MEGKSDLSSLAGYAKESVAACIKAGMVNGKNGNILDPKGKITIAEVAVIVQRFLQKAKLM